MAISKKIREFRIRAKFSQFQLELEISASPGSISRIESGQTNPTKETLHKISKCLKLSPEETAYILGVELSLMQGQIKDYQDLKDAFDLSRLDAYELIKNYDIDQVFEEIIKSLEVKGYINPCVYLTQPHSDIYELKKARVLDTSLSIAKQLINKDIYSIKYSLKDQTLITHAILSGKLQYSDKLFELIVPHLGELYIIQGVQNARYVIALPLTIEEKIIGCITLLSNMEVTNEMKTELETFAKKAAGKIFTAQIKEESEKKYFDAPIKRNKNLLNKLKDISWQGSIRNPLKIDYYMKLFWVIFLFFTVWWILESLKPNRTNEQLNIWSDLYFFMAVYAVIIGWKAYKIIGGYKNKVGYMILFLVLISLGHVVGQIINAVVFYYTYLGYLYPSPGEIGFASSCALSVFLSFFILRFLRNRNAVYTQFNYPFIIISLSIIFILIKYAYLNSLGDYWSSIEPFTLAFDMYYNIGQSIAVAVALVCIAMLRSALMCKETKMFFLLYFVSSFLLYLADAIFFFKYHTGTWLWGDIADFMYFLYYSVISYGHVVLLSTIRRDLLLQEQYSPLSSDYSKEVGVIVNKLIS